MKSYLVVIFGLLGLFGPAAGLGAQSLLKRGGVDVVDHTDNEESSPISLAVSVGGVGLDEIEHGRFVLTVTPRIRLLRAATRTLTLTIPTLWIPDTHPDPWDDPPCIPDIDMPCLEAESLDVGPSIVLAPSLEWTFRTDCCLQPSVFVGAGLWHDRGRRTHIPGRGDFETDDETSPLVTLGGALTRPLSARVALRVEARLVTTFYDEMTVTGPSGSFAGLDGGDVTSAFLTVGVEFDF